MGAIVFDVSEFRTEFPVFASAATYPDADLSGTFTTATYYISDTDYGRLNGDKRKYALYLMTAHLVALSDLIKAGESPASVVSATIGSVSVSVKPAPDGPQWQWWLNQTPYGQQLSALIATRAAFGFYVGGRRERSAFRKSGGGFY
jgi:hypothetical protein